MSHSGPEQPTETCVITNRVFLLSLDEIYRDAVMQHERRELLKCARSVAEALEVEAADVPVEGYYASKPDLTSLMVAAPIWRNSVHSFSPRQLRNLQ